MLSIKFALVSNWLCSASSKSPRGTVPLSSPMYPLKVSCFCPASAISSIPPQTSQIP